MSIFWHKIIECELSIFWVIPNSKIGHLLYPKLSRITALTKKHSSIFLMQKNLTLKTWVHNLQNDASWGRKCGKESKLNKTWSSVSNSTSVLPIIPFPFTLYPYPLSHIPYPISHIPYLLSLPLVPYPLFLSRNLGEGYCDCDCCDWPKTGLWQ